MTFFLDFNSFEMSGRNGHNELKREKLLWKITQTLNLTILVVHFYPSASFLLTQLFVVHDVSDVNGGF